MSQFDDVGPDDPLGDSGMPPDGPGLDSTGLTDLMAIMRAAFQFMTAARLSGFSEAQASTIARDYISLMVRMSIERNQP